MAVQARGRAVGEREDLEGEVRTFGCGGEFTQLLAVGLRSPDLATEEGLVEDDVDGRRGVPAQEGVAAGGTGSDPSFGIGGSNQGPVAWMTARA